MVDEALFSSEKTDWETPAYLFEFYNEKYKFTMDVCANRVNHTCKKYFTEKDNGLIQVWGGHTCWMNPPYGNTIDLWVAKARAEYFRNGTRTVALLPARTDTKWFHKNIYNQFDYEFICGRVKFVGGNHSAPFPSMVVFFE